MPWLDYLLTIDWVTAGKIALSAGLGSALVQGLFSIFGERRRRKAQAAYLAMRVSVLLDAFGLACSDMIARNAGAEALPDEEYPDLEGLPELPPYPEDKEGWVALDTAVAMRCLRLPSSVRAGGALLNATNEYARYDLDLALDEQAAKLGLEARGLADDLRRAYGLPPEENDYADSLKATLQRATKVAGDRQRRRNESMQRMT